MIRRIPLAPRLRLLVGRHPYRWLESAWIANAKSWERRFVVLTVLIGLEGIRAAPKHGVHVVKAQAVNRDPASVTRFKNGLLWLGRWVNRSVSRWLLRIRKQMP